MVAGQISEKCADLLDRIFPNSNIPITTTMMEELKQLELIMEAPLWENVSPIISENVLTEENTILSKVKEMPVFAIALNVAQMCNLKCVYCYGNEGEYDRKGLMEDETAIKVVDWLIEYSKSEKQIAINFFGGEPLINFPLLKRIVKYAAKKAKECLKEVKFSITSNATLLDDDIIAFLNKYKIQPIISFDGPADIQDIKRPFKNGSGSYEIVTNNIKKLLLIIPKAICRATISDPESFSRVQAVIKEIGFLFYYLVSESPSLFKNNNVKRKAKNIRTSAGMVEYLESVANEALQSIKNRSIESIDAKILSVLEDITFQNKRYYACGAGRGYFGISSSGDLYPCHRFIGMQKVRIGSIYDDRLVRKVYQNTLVTQLNKCSRCWVKYFCGGGCMHINKATTDSFFEPNNVFCEEMQFTTEMGIHIYCQLDKSDITFLKEIIETSPRRAEFYN